MTPFKFFRNIKWRWPDISPLTLTGLYIDEDRIRNSPIDLE